MMNSPRLIAAVAGIFLSSVFAVNVRGLHLGKKVARSGSAITLVLAGLMVYLLVRRLGGNIPAATRPFQFAIPGQNPTFLFDNGVNGTWYLFDWVTQTV